MGALRRVLAGVASSSLSSRAGRTLHQKGSSGFTLNRWAGVAGLLPFFVSGHLGLSMAPNAFPGMEEQAGDYVQRQGAPVALQTDAFDRPAHPLPVRHSRGTLAAVLTKARHWIRPREFYSVPSRHARRSNLSISEPHSSQRKTFDNSFEEPPFLDEIHFIRIYIFSRDSVSFQVSARRTVRRDCVLRVFLFLPMEAQNRESRFDSHRIA